MPQMDGATANFHVSRWPVRHIACLRWNRVGQAQLVRCDDAIGHDAYTVTPRDGGDRLFHIDWCRPLKDAANAGQIIKPSADATEVTVLCQSRQRLIDSITAADVEEVFGCANPLPTAF